MVLSSPSVPAPRHEGVRLGVHRSSVHSSKDPGRRDAEPSDGRDRDVDPGARRSSRRHESSDGRGYPTPPRPRFSQEQHEKRWISGFSPLVAACSHQLGGRRRYHRPRCSPSALAARLRTATAGGSINAAFLGLALGRDRDSASEDRNSFLWPSSPDIRDHRAKETPSCHQRRSAKSGPPRRDSARDLDGDGSGLRKCVRSLDDSRLVLAGWKGRWPSAARACGAEIGGFAPHTRYAAVAVNG